MKRWLFSIFAAVSLLLCLGVCVLWVRGYRQRESVYWTYDRYLSDKRAASNRVELMSSNRLWLGISWGDAPPFNGSLVYGYYINADKSQGRPRFGYHHEHYGSGFLGPPARYSEDSGASGAGPIRWMYFTRSMPVDLDNFRFIHIGMSHWLVILLLLAPPAWWLRRTLAERRARLVGHCPVCGYDLRATPDRCPECGYAQPAEA